MQLGWGVGQVSLLFMVLYHSPSFLPKHYQFWTCSQHLLPSTTSSCNYLLVSITPHHSVKISSPLLTVALSCYSSEWCQYWGRGPFQYLGFLVHWLLLLQCIPWPFCPWVIPQNLLPMIASPSLSYSKAGDHSLGFQLTPQRVPSLIILQPQETYDLLATPSTILLLFHCAALATLIKKVTQLCPAGWLRGWASDPWTRSWVWFSSGHMPRCGSNSWWGACSQQLSMFLSLHPPFLSLSTIKNKHIKDNPTSTSCLHFYIWMHLKTTNHWI